MSGKNRRRQQRAQRAETGERKVRLRDGPLHGETRHVGPDTRVFYSTFVDVKGRKHQIAYTPDLTDPTTWHYRGVTEVS